MTEEKRKFYDTQFMMARLSMSQNEYDDWVAKSRGPSSTSWPDGIFESVQEYKDYFNYE